MSQRHPMWQGLVARASLSLVVLASACARRAPGPEECGDLAVRWAGPPLAERGALAGAAEGARASDIEEIARLCVTTPFDRKVIRCAEEGGGPERCLQAFRDRRQRELADGT